MILIMHRIVLAQVLRGGLHTDGIGVRQMQKFMLLILVSFIASTQITCDTLDKLGKRHSCSLGTCYHRSLPELLIYRSAGCRHAGVAARDTQLVLDLSLSRLNLFVKDVNVQDKGKIYT